MPPLVLQLPSARRTGLALVALGALSVLPCCVDPPGSDARSGDLSPSQLALAGPPEPTPEPAPVDSATTAATSTATTAATSTASATDSRWLSLQVVFDMASPEAPRRQRARAALQQHWRPGYAPLLLELLPFMAPAQRGELLTLLRQTTGQDFGTNRNAWYEWLWSQERQAHPAYGEFKSVVYAQIDPRFGPYFKDRTARINLDEVRWGGVAKDGIPPLRQPQTVSKQAAEAWLKDDHVVFGVALDGQARAYPKRILAWHEMVVDRLGETPFTGVYCTLCGSMIVYKSIDAHGTHHQLGTSGFLYRSNKLMYDQATDSLWSTLDGRPVIGPLADKQGQEAIQLEALYVVTTTWGEWKRRHPQTDVLSLETGHRRDYGEGVAYREHFASDELMFNVPKPPTSPGPPGAVRSAPRLKNKAPVLALRFGQLPDADPQAKPLAIESAFLAPQPVYAGQHAGIAYVVLTDPSGAHRVYRQTEPPLQAYDGQAQARDANGQVYQVKEDGLYRGAQRVQPRLPHHRAFWFGWRAAFPHTELIQRP